MKKFFNILNWVVIVAIAVVGLALVAVAYVPEEYAKPIFDYLHISYEWCLGVGLSGVGITLMTVFTKLLYGARIRAVVSQNAKQTQFLDLVKGLFEKTVETNNDLALRLKQTENSVASIVEMEKEIAKERKTAIFMSKENADSLTNALMKVEQLTAENKELSQLTVVKERIIDKVDTNTEAPEKTQETAIDGLI